jgi:hypothetical protein
MMCRYQVLGPILAKQASTQPSAILYFTAVVLGSYGLTIFGSYGLLEYSRRVGGGGGLLGSRIANTPPVTKPIAAPVAVPVATSAAPEPAATTTSGAVGASAAGIRKPKLLRTTSLEAQRGAGGGDHELLGLISSEISLLAIQLKGHPAQSGVLRLQSLLRASSSMAPRSPNRSSHHTPSKIGPAAVQVGCSRMNRPYRGVWVASGSRSQRRATPGAKQFACPVSLFLKSAERLT